MSDMPELGRSLLSAESSISDSPQRANGNMVPVGNVVAALKLKLKQKDQVIQELLSMTEVVSSDYDRLQEKYNGKTAEQRHQEEVNSLKTKLRDERNYSSMLERKLNEAECTVRRAEWALEMWDRHRREKDTQDKNFKTGAEETERKLKKHTELLKITQEKYLAEGRELLSCRIKVKALEEELQLSTRLGTTLDASSTSDMAYVELAASKQKIDQLESELEGLRNVQSSSDSELVNAEKKINLLEKQLRHQARGRQSTSSVERVPSINHYPESDSPSAHSPTSDGGQTSDANLPLRSTSGSRRAVSL